MVISGPPEPIPLFTKWLNEAREAGALLPERAALGTVNPECRPAVRMVLVKHADQDGFVFYTSLKSTKAADLEANPQAALCFHWPETGKQVRVEGGVTLVNDREADAYFAKRPRESRLAAWASQQSAVLADRNELERRYCEAEKKYEGREVPRPPWWSGYRLRPAQIEFWREVPHRLHDRLLYTKTAEGGWNTRSLYP